MISLLALSTPAWSGLSAIGGALVGGAVPAVVTIKSARERQRFEQAQRKKDFDRADTERDALVRGAARVWQLRFKSFNILMGACVSTNSWPLTVLDMDEGIPVEDRKLVAALCTSAEWSAVCGGEFDISTVLAGRQAALNDVRGSELALSQITPEAKTIELFTNVQGDVLVAAAALDRLARDEEPKVAETV